MRMNRTLKIISLSSIFLLRTTATGAPLPQGYITALKHIGARQCNKSIAGLKKIITNDPSFFRAYARLADVCGILHRQDEAKRGPFYWAPFVLIGSGK